MMNFLGNLCWVVMTMTIVIIFLCISVIGLGVLDWAFDTDVKGYLTKALGSRHWIGRIRLKLVELARRLDTPSDRDLMDICEKTNEVRCSGLDEYNNEIDELKRRLEMNDICQKGGKEK